MVETINAEPALWDFGAEIDLRQNIVPQLAGRVCASDATGCAYNGNLHLISRLRR